MSTPSQPPLKQKKRSNDAQAPQVGYERRRPPEYNPVGYQLDVPYSGPEPVYSLRKSEEGQSLDSPPLSPSFPQSPSAAPGKRSKLGDIFGKKQRGQQSSSSASSTGTGTKSSALKSSLAENKSSQPDSDQEDFDWDRDDDLDDNTMDDDEAEKLKEMKKKEKSARRTRCAVVFNWIGSFPFVVRAILYIIALNAILLPAGLVDFFFFANSFYTLEENEKFIDPDNTAWRFEKIRSPWSIMGVPIILWALFFAISGTLFFVIKIIVRFAPNFFLKLYELIVGSYGSTIKHTVDYITHLQGSISLFVWMWAVNATFRSIFNPMFWRYHEARLPETLNNRGLVQFYTEQTLICLAIIATFYLLEQWTVQVISVNFHRSAYKDRIRKNRSDAQVLEKLNNHRRNARFTKYNGRRDGSSSVSSVQSTKIPTAFEVNAAADARSGSGYNSDQSETSTVTVGREKRRAKSSASGDRGKNGAKHVVQGISDFVVGNFDTDWNFAAIASREEARQLARKLWEAYCPPNRKELIMEDLREVFNSEKELSKAFDIFDKNSNGDVSKIEMKSAVLAVYHEKKVIEKSLRSVGSAVGKLNYIFLVLLAIISLFVFLHQYDVPTGQIITSVGSFMVAATFMFGPTVKTLFESTIFLFVTHPYDIGDRVDVDNYKFFVLDMGLLTTIFKGIDGKQYYVPNIVLSAKFIHNVRRSGFQSSTIRLEVDPNTTSEQIQQFRGKLQAFLNHESNRDFSGKFELVVDNIKDSTLLPLKIVVEHRSNWQDGVKVRSRNSRLHLAIRDAIRELEITYSVTTVAHSCDTEAAPMFFGSPVPQSSPRL